MSMVYDALLSVCAILLYTNLNYSMNTNIVWLSCHKISVTLKSKVKVTLLLLQLKKKCFLHRLDIRLVSGLRNVFCFVKVSDPTRM